MTKSFLFATLLLFTSLSSQAQKFAVPVSESQEKMMEGKFAPTWSSLESRYQVPEWFSNAKFGI